MTSIAKAMSAREEMGSLITRAREALGMTREDLATRALVETTTIWRLETGVSRNPHRASLYNIIQIIKPGLWQIGTWGSFCHVADQLDFDPYQRPPGSLFFGMNGEITPSKIRLVLPHLRGFTFDGNPHAVVDLSLDIIGTVQESEWTGGPEAHELLALTFKELAFAYNQVHPPENYQASVSAAISSLRHAQQVAKPKNLRNHLLGGAYTALGSILRVLREEEFIHPSPRITTLQRQIHNALPIASPFDYVLQSGSAPDRIWSRINLMKMERFQAPEVARYRVVEQLALRALEDLADINPSSAPTMATWGLAFESTAHLLPSMLHESTARVFAHFGAMQEALDQLTEARNSSPTTYGTFQNELTYIELLLRSTARRQDGIDQLRGLPDRAPGPYPRHKALRLLEQTAHQRQNLWVVPSPTKSRPPYLLDPPEVDTDPLAG